MSTPDISKANTRNRHWLRALYAAGLLLPAGMACAESDDTKQAAADRPASDAAQAGKDATTDIYARFDRLREQGALVRLPPIRDTILRDTGGMRSALAEHGIGVMLLSVNNAAYDVSSPVPASPQRYNGQDFTASGFQQLLITYNFAPRGNDQSQFILGINSAAASWEPMGPRSKIALSRLAYYRTFNDRQWELKIGYVSNLLEYLGTYTGGSMTGGTQGLSAVIPFQVGLTRLPLAAPGFNLQYNGKNGFYNKFGLQRSVSPDGAQAEVDANSKGFRFRTPGSNLLLINEVGIKRNASPTHQSIWLRAGVIQNWSNYRRFGEPTRSDGNRALYASGDVQLTLPPNRALPTQGWYAGASVHYAPQDRNLYTRYYEARAYRIGTFRNRPADMLSMTASHTKFSENASDAYTARGLSSADAMTTMTVSYMTRVQPGIYLSTGVSRITNPTFSPRMDDVLNLTLGLNMFF